MPVLTPTLLAMFALLLVAGWLFGLASHPGGRKWKTRYAAEREAHAANRKAADVQLAEARKGDGDTLAQARARIAELERENARLANAAPVMASAIGTNDRIIPRPTPSSHPLVTPRTAYAPGERPGWFDWKTR